jgi:HK97 family phage portal protein
MTLMLYGPDGSLLPLDDGGPSIGPWQYTPEGFNTGLASNSQPLHAWMAGASVYRQMYMRQLWVKVCVDKLTYQVARLPLKIYEGDPLNKKLVTDGPLHEALRTPLPGKRTMSFTQWAIKPALIYGASALRILTSGPGAAPSGFRPLYWQWLQPYTTDGTPDGEVDYWIYTPPNAKPETLLPHEVLLIAWETADGRVGESPLRPLLDTLRIEYALKRWQESLVLNGVRPPGGIALSDNPELLPLAKDTEYRRRFEAEVQRMRGGPDNAGKLLMLPPGAKWMSFAYNANEAEIVAQRKLTVPEVAAAYDISPPNVGWLEGMARSGLEVITPGLYKTTLPPWLTLIQESFGGQVIDPNPTFAGQWIMYDLGDVTRGDPEQEASALKTLSLSGLMTINEARAKLNLPRIEHPDADKPLIPVNNMTFLGGTPLRDPGSEPTPGNSAQVQALLGNVQRACDRVVRRLKAGETGAEAFDSERFERELRDDLDRRRRERQRRRHRQGLDGRDRRARRQRRGRPRRPSAARRAHHRHRRRAVKPTHNPRPEVAARPAEIRQAAAAGVPSGSGRRRSRGAAATRPGVGDERARPRPPRARLRSCAWALHKRTLAALAAIARGEIRADAAASR